MKRTVNVCLLCLTLISGNLLADEIQVVTEISPPYQTLNENNHVSGTATALVKSILKEAGLTGRFSIYPWARSYELAQTSPGVLIYSMARNSERDQYFDWIAPVARFKLAFMGLTSSNIEVDENIPFNHSIAVQRDDISYKWLKRRGLRENKHFLVCADILCSWDLLLKGNVELVIDDPLLAKTTLSQMGRDPDVVKMIKPIPSLDIVGYLALSKGGDPLVLQKLKGAAIKIEQSK